MGGGVCECVVVWWCVAPAGSGLGAWEPGSLGEPGRAWEILGSWEKEEEGQAEIGRIVVSKVSHS